MATEPAPFVGCLPKNSRGPEAVLLEHLDGEALLRRPFEA
jgi:hypothetical protein